MNLDPVFSSVSLRGRNLQMTLMESSLAVVASFSSDMVGQVVLLMKALKVSTLELANVQLEI